MRYASATAAPSSGGVMRCAILRLLLLLSARTLMVPDASAQAGYPFEHPFTDKELFEALRLGSTDSAARRLVADMRRAEGAMRDHFAQHRREEARGAPAAEVEPAFGAALSEETLIILSLLGPETEAKVEQYLAALRGPRGPDPEFERVWRERRDQLRPWVERMRRSPPGGA
jgi:hypothetical protein